MSCAFTGNSVDHFSPVAVTKCYRLKLRFPYSMINRPLSQPLNRRACTCSLPLHWAFVSCAQREKYIAQGPGVPCKSNPNIRLINTRLWQKLDSEQSTGKVISAYLMRKALWDCAIRVEPSLKMHSEATFHVLHSCRGYFWWYLCCTQMQSHLCTSAAMQDQPIFRRAFCTRWNQKNRFLLAH